MDSEEAQLKNHFVITIAGPMGVGKTTLSKMLSSHYNCSYISEDELAKELFPEIYINIEGYPEKLKIAESQLFQRAKEIFDNGKCVVIDMINLDKEFIQEMRQAFHKHLILKVLCPAVETTIERDKQRKVWTSSENAIKLFYKRYEKLKQIIGEENYIDNSHQTPEETLETFIATIEQNKF